MRGGRVVLVLVALAACGLFPDVTGLAPGVVVGAFCVDATEVTNAEYAVFLATLPDPSKQIAACGWNTSFAQTTSPTAAMSDLPAVNLDWCDAYAYCAWAGKHLCGRVGGGAQETNTTSLDEPSSDEWFEACSHDGTLTFPYGTKFQQALCNVPDNDAGALLSASTLSGCMGGYPGALDMVGNADEWENACDDAGSGNAALDDCVRRSGSFVDPPGAQQTCAFSRTGARSKTDDDIGFRCCADLAP